MIQFRSQSICPFSYQVRNILIQKVLRVLYVPSCTKKPSGIITSYKFACRQEQRGQQQFKFAPRINWEKLPSKTEKNKTKFSRVLGFSKTLTYCAVISKNIAPIHFIKCIFPPKKFIMYFCEMYYKVMLCANLLIGAELLFITSTNWQH